MDKQELLDKYLAGNLNEEETAAFNELRAADHAFNDEVTFHDDLREVVFEDERLRLKQVLADKKAASTKSNKKKPRTLLLISLAVLVILASIFTYRYQQRQKSPEGIYASYFEPYPNSYRPVSRNALNTAETQGFTAYENGNYTLAAEKFEESLDQKQDLSIIFYQGIAYGALGEISLAIQKMESVKGRDFPYSSESYWYLGLYYLRKDKIDASTRNFRNYIDLGEDAGKVALAKVIIKKIN